MDAVSAIIFVVVFAAVLAAYALGRGGARLPLWYLGSRSIHRYRPPVRIVLEYRDGRGARTRRTAAILSSLAGPGGRIYLFALSGKERKLKLFRVDRIISVASADGEVIDTTRFLTGRLAIPPAFCRAMR